MVMSWSCRTWLKRLPETQPIAPGNQFEQVSTATLQQPFHLREVIQVALAIFGGETPQAFTIMQF